MKEANFDAITAKKKALHFRATPFLETDSA